MFSSVSAVFRRTCEHEFAEVHSRCSLQSDRPAAAFLAAAATPAAVLDCGADPRLRPSVRTTAGDPDQYSNEAHGVVDWFVENPQQLGFLQRRIGAAIWRISTQKLRLQPALDALREAWQVLLCIVALEYYEILIL